MRRIATELGAGTMTLYGSLSDREALLAAMSRRPWRGSCCRSVGELAR